jgi:hypothetical protein
MRGNSCPIGHVHSLARFQARLIRRQAQELRLEAGVLRGESEFVHSMLVSERKRLQNEALVRRRAAGQRASLPGPRAA